MYWKVCQSYEPQLELTITRATQLSAHNSGICNVPSRGTYLGVGTIKTDLDHTLGVRCSTNQTNITTGALRTIDSWQENEQRTV